MQNLGSNIHAKIFLIAIVVICISCDKDADPAASSLEAYIQQNPEWRPHNELVACAAGGQQGFLDDPTAPLSMFFYPKLYSTNFKYYETEGDVTDADDLSLYLEKDVPWEPLFNGFMARYPLPKPETDRWSRVSFVSNDTLWYCKPVRLRINEDPTNFLPEIIEINFDEDAQPDFSWPLAQDPNTIIYFQIVVDERGDAVSATYTNERKFSFYETSNVVFNVTRPGPVLPLQRNQEYSFVLMAISDINWVETIAQKSFTTQ